MIKTVGKIYHHIRCVQRAIKLVASEMENRAAEHDASKFNADELEGYAKFEDFPEGLKYGSDEYKAEMAKVMGEGAKRNNCFDLHSQRNDHHPEHWIAPIPLGTKVGISHMGLFPLIEMVCDWAGATVEYGNKGKWEESVDYNINRFPFNEHQKWVIRQVANYLAINIEELRG